MKKVKKIKIKVNGKLKSFNHDVKLSNLVYDLNIPIKKVAIELNNKLIDIKKLNKINLKNDDKIEIVHFIGGG